MTSTSEAATPTFIAGTLSAATYLRTVGVASAATTANARATSSRFVDILFTLSPPGVAPGQWSPPSSDAIT